MKQAGISHILSTVLLLASCSIGAGASALIDGDGVSIVGGSTKLVTRSTVPIILSDFNITVTDVSGHSDGIQSRELNQAHGAPSNHKRDVSRAIDTCPPGVPHFIRSTCDHTSGSLNFKSYTVTCSSFDPGAIVTRLIAFPDPITPGSCGPNEFCFQNNHNQNAPVAYCVSQTNMITLVAAGASPSGASQVSLDITGPAHNLLGNTIEVVISTPDARTVVKMDSISVTALAMDKINGQESYRAQVGGTNSCQACSSIELLTVPQRTAKLRWDFSFHGVAAGASMFVIYWATT